MLVVIAIVGVLAAITVPALSNMKRSDAMVSATRQMLDDLGRARQLAISRHTTVYMVFVPYQFYSDPNFLSLTPTALGDPGTNLFDKQLIGYTFVTLRSIGAQPGELNPDYIGPWHTMPEGTFIATNKFFGPNYFVTDPPGSLTPFRKYPINVFSYTNAIPFPTEEAYSPADKNRKFANVPYVAFNYLGQLVSGQGDEYIPLARGTVLHRHNQQTKVAIAGPPLLAESPPGNSTNIINLIHIDRLTGRARLIQQELQ